MEAGLCGSGPVVVSRLVVASRLVVVSRPVVVSRLVVASGPVVASGLAPRWAAERPQNQTLSFSRDISVLSLGLLRSPTRGKPARHNKPARHKKICQPC